MARQERAEIFALLLVRAHTPIRPFALFGDTTIREYFVDAMVLIN